jgi:hypothetical protein
VIVDSPSRQQPSRLFKPTICQQRLTGGATYNDAKACFDRVIKNTTNLTVLKEGLPLKIAQLHSQTIHQIKYYLRHQRGVAVVPNQHSPQTPFYGVGQGAGDSPARWGYISDIIIKAYNKHATDAKITSPIHLIVSNEKVMAFIDDSRLFLILHNSNGFVVRQQIAHNTQLWERLLHVVGGKLELSKSKILIFSWRFNSEGTAILDNQYNKLPFHLLDSETSTPMTLDTVLTSDAYKLLGVHVAFDSNTTAQQTALQAKYNHLIRVFAQATTMDRQDTMTGIQILANSTLKYMLPATNIPWDTINKINQKFIYIILPKIGLNRHFPRAVIFAPSYFGGAELIHLPFEQGVAHILLILRHLRAYTTLGTILHQALEAYQVHACLLHPPLEYTQHIPYVYALWINTSRTFLHKIDGKITIQTLPPLPLLRLHDNSIMQIAIDQNTFTKHELQLLNNCRLFLQITNLAEITNNSGTEIHPQYISNTPIDRPQ